MTSWYSWAFDGIGATALLSVCGVFYRRFLVKKKPDDGNVRVSSGSSSALIVESPGGLGLSAPVTDSQLAVGSNINQSVEIHHHHVENVISEDWNPTKPTPEEILQEIGAALPFDREHAREKYVGLRVVWSTYLSVVTKSGMNWYMITRSSCNIGYTQVCFGLTSIQPELKSAKEGSTLLIRGTIRSLGMSDIELQQDPNIKIVKRS